MSPCPDRCVVDTNVAMAADGRATASLECVLACIDALRAVMEGGHLFVDDEWRIVTEYRRNLTRRGQPTAGTEFLKWVLTNQANAARCTLVPSTQRSGDPEDFAEFPAHPGLANFDPADRKFVAVAAAHAEQPPILQATDTKWRDWAGPLADNGIRVHFVCDDHPTRAEGRPDRAATRSASSRARRSRRR